MEEEIPETAPDEMTNKRMTHTNKHTLFLM